MAYVSTDPDRRCEVCSGPITPKNQSGICTRNKECRSALQRVIAGKQTPPTLDTPDNCPWLLPIVYDLDTGEEIIDETAIAIAVEGTRHVGLTLTERREVVRRMIAGSWDVQEIAHHCGTTRARLDPIMNELGYEVVPTIKPNGARGRANIRKIKEAV